MNGVEHGQETTLKVDTATGFLVSSREDRITVELKQSIVEKYAKTGNLTTACRENGVDPRIMRIHYHRDAAYRQAIDEARQQICDKAESHIVEHMSRPGNVIDRLSWLRSYRPSIWNPASKLTVDVSVNQVQSTVDKLNAYDAELVERTSPIAQNVTECNTIEQNTSPPVDSLTSLNKTLQPLTSPEYPTPPSLTSAPPPELAQHKKGLP